MAGTLRLRIAAGALAVLGSVTLSAGPGAPSSRDAASLRQKIAAIADYGAHPLRANAQRMTTVTENEVNAYLAIDARPDIPAGVVEPAVTILGGGRLSGRAVVDLDARAVADVRKAHDALDQVLDVRQQARFRVFEENMERRKLELVARARQANRARKQQ